jgi:hypothetical protein
MEIGMLWYDDTRRPLDEKVARAVEHYKTKYGTAPTVCYLNPATLNGSGEAAGAAAGIQLRQARNVLVDHFWIGVGDAPANGKAAPNGGAARSRNGHGRTNGRARGNGRRNGRKAG